MSTPKTPEETASDPTLVETISDGMDPLMDIIKAIVIQDRYVIEDRWGNSYAFRPAACASQELTAMMIAKSLWASVGDQLAEMRGQSKAELMAALGDAYTEEGRQAEGLKQLGNLFIQAVTLPEVHKQVDVIWKTIHSDSLFGEGLYDLSMDNVRKKWVSLGRPVEDCPTPHVTEMFDSADILTGLLPFIARFVTKVFGAVTTAMGKETAPATSSPATRPLRSVS